MPYFRHIILLNVLLLSVFGTEMTPESVQTNSGSLPMLSVTGLRPVTIWACFSMSESVNDFVAQSRPHCSRVALSVTQVTSRTALSPAQEVIKQSTNSHNHIHTQLCMIQLSGYGFIGILAEVIIRIVLVVQSQLCWVETFTTPGTSHFITKTLSSPFNSAGRCNN